MDWRLKMAETPFGQNTRQNIRPMNPLTFAAGGRESQALPRVGYLARLHWHFSGTLTVTLGGGTAALDEFGPWNALNRVRLLANSGQDIFSTSGYGAYLVDVTSGPAAKYPADGGYLTTDINPRVYAAATAAGANAWEFGATMPIAVNEETELGLILLQNEMAQTTFALEYNSLVYSTTASLAPVLVTGAATATLSGTVTPLVEYFSVPADLAARPDISWLHQTLEFAQAVGSTGDNTVNLLRDNLYLYIMHLSTLNRSANGVDIERWRLVMNQSDTPYDFTNRGGFQFQRRMFGQDLPEGLIVYPLFSQGFPGFGSERDLVNGRATSELQSILTIASGATLGTSPTISTITRQLVKLAAPTTQGS